MQTKYYAGKLETERVDLQIALSAHYTIVCQLAVMVEHVTGS